MNCNDKTNTAFESFDAGGDRTGEVHGATFEEVG